MNAEQEYTGGPAWHINGRIVDAGTNPFRLLQNSAT